MIRAQAVLLPLLRAASPGVKVSSVAQDVDNRELPAVQIDRVGGSRNPVFPELHSKPLIRMTAVSDEGLIEAEELYEASLDALYAAVRAQQTVPGLGHLQSLTEASGGMRMPSPEDIWSVGGTLQLALCEG